MSYELYVVFGPILWGRSGPLCHALSLLLSLWTSILHCHSPGVAAVARRLRYSWLRLILVVVSTVATPGEWQCKIRTGGVRLVSEIHHTTIHISLSTRSRRSSQLQSSCSLRRFVRSVYLNLTTTAQRDRKHTDSCLCLHVDTRTRILRLFGSISLSGWIGHVRLYRATLC